jgi:hypothetical protein
MINARLLLIVSLLILVINNYAFIKRQFVKKN